MVGLAVLVVMQVQGTSAIKGWRLPTKFPDLFIVYPSAMSAGLIGDGGPTPVGDAQVPPVPPLAEGSSVEAD
jgi:hypothetical protein